MFSLLGPLHLARRARSRKTKHYASVYGHDKNEENDRQPIVIVWMKTFIVDISMLHMFTGLGQENKESEARNVGWEHDPKPKKL